MVFAPAVRVASAFPIIGVGILQRMRFGFNDEGSRRKHAQTVQLREPDFACQGSDLSRHPLPLCLCLPTRHLARERPAIYTPRMITNPILAPRIGPMLFSALVAVLVAAMLAFSVAAEAQPSPGAEPAAETGGAEQDQPRARPLALQGPFRVDKDRVIDGWRYNLRWREGPGAQSNGRFALSNVTTPSATPTDQACEREIGIAVRDFVRKFVRGKQLKTREVREGREIKAWVGLLQAGRVDMSTLLLEMGVAIPYDDNQWNPELRHWDCALNDAAWQGLREAGFEVPETAGQ